MYFDENNNFFDLLTNENEIEINKYIDKSKLINNNINIDNINFRSVSLFDPLEGFNKGNMFINEYRKYKNHSYKLKTNNIKDELLYKIQMYNFAIKDLNLYLDLHPENTEMLNKFQELNFTLNELKKKYNVDYGPLTICDINNVKNWTWIDNPWPWDKGGN